MSDTVDALKIIEKAKLSPQHKFVAHLLLSVEDWERKEGRKITWREVVDSGGSILDASKLT